MEIQNPKKGISMLEIIIAIFIISVALTSLLGLISFSLRTGDLIKQTTRANSLAQEAMEAVRNFRDNTAWATTGIATLTTGVSYYPNKTTESPPKWDLIQGEEIIDGFARKIVFEKVYRDDQDNIADSGTEDPNTKKVIVTVSWQKRGISHQIEVSTYLTNWQQK